MLDRRLLMAQKTAAPSDDFYLVTGEFVSESDSFPFVITHNCGVTPIFFLIYDTKLENTAPRSTISVLACNSIIKASTQGNATSTTTTAKITSGELAGAIAEGVGSGWAMSGSRVFVSAMDEMTCTLQEGLYGAPLRTGDTFKWVALCRRA